MSILFFEGFNIGNNDTTVYLDPQYWTRPYITEPRNTFYASNYISPFGQVAQVAFLNTTSDRGSNAFLAMSGAKIYTNPAQFQTPIQLSGISELSSSSGIFLSFRSVGFSHAPTSTPFPYAQKLIALCTGDTEEIVIEGIQTTGQPPIPGWVASTGGLGLRIKQSGEIIGIFDLRVNGISNYNVTRSSNDLSFQQVRSQFGDVGIRYVHNEFFFNISGNKIHMRLEGIDNIDSLTNNIYITINKFSFDNIKFYNRLINQTMFETGSSTEWYGNIGYDDIVVSNTSGVSANTWLGRETRIVPYLLSDTLSPDTIELSENWSSFMPGGVNTLATPKLAGRDTDYYIESYVTGSIYSISPLTQAGPSNSWMPLQDIGGIKFSNEARKTQLDSAFINVYATGVGAPSGNYAEIGNTYFVDSTQYKMFHSFIWNLSLIT